MYISASQIKKLELSLNKSNKGIERIIIHDEPSEKVQLMLIAFKKGKKYPAFSDNLPGWITFFVLKGSLTINIYDYQEKKKKTSQKLLVSEFYKLQRNLFRETIGSSEENTLFLEIIEGEFDKSKRIQF